MFTGIVQDTAEIIEITEAQNFRTHTLRFSDALLHMLAPGASVAHNGCCLTVTRINGNQVSFDLMHETLRVTNLGLLTLGDRVNIERAARFGDEIGGHIMSGHIIGLGKVIQIIQQPNHDSIWFELPPQLAHYLFPKGFIGIDGISLTLGEVDQYRFCVHLIPETLQRTVIQSRTVGSLVNIEIDPHTQVIVNTVQRLLAYRRLANHTGS